MTTQDKFYEAWNYLYDHKMFKDDSDGSHFLKCLDIDVVKVNPAKGSIDVNDNLNTQVEIWLECGELEKLPHGWFGSHDVDLDCGGETFEEAIIKLSKLVKKHYGDGKE